MNNLELELWPKATEFSNSGIIDETEVSDGELETKSNSAAASLANIHALSNSSFVNENLATMTGSMAGAKNLLDEVKDPLGINDSLYQYKSYYLHIYIYVHLFFLECKFKEFHWIQSIINR